MNNRKQWLDIARGICLICMISCHAFDWSKQNLELIPIIGMWFLVFFFFSSGLCFSDKYSFKEYIIRQGKKLALPYFIITIIYLLYRIYRGMWWDASPPIRALRFFASLFTALPGEFQDLHFWRTNNIGIGPIWFLLCLFFAATFYKALYKSKYKLIISIVLAALATYSQKYIVLPLTLQNACIGCMFIAFGDASKEYVFKFVDKMKKLPILLLIGSCGCIYLFYIFLLRNLPFQILNLGGNAYSLCSIPTSLTGFIFLIALSVLCERIKIIANFLSYCGKNSLYIVIIHNIDILMARNWGIQGDFFLIGTILSYPLIIYIYQKIKKKIDCECDYKDCDKNCDYGCHEDDGTAADDDSEDCKEDGEEPPVYENHQEEDIIE